jgi:glycosyltransferase involved in cell wall biosynthesis
MQGRIASANQPPGIVQGDRLCYRLRVMATAIVLSTSDLSEAATGGSRRVQALLEALGSHAVLVQPRVPHPRYPTVPYPRDLGRRKWGINWGIFNFYTPSARRIAGGLLRAHRPALAVMTSIWSEVVLRGVPELPAVLDAHDVNATAVAERFGAGHPFTRLVRAQERRAVHRAEHLFACSDRDRDQFLALYGLPPDRVSVVPNGVDVAAFDAVDASSPDPNWDAAVGSATALLFMGKLDYQPNVEGLAFLQEQVLPALEAQDPGRFRLVVCGGPVPARPLHPAVHYAGRLPTPRLYQYLKRADLCLAPVFTGSGTRLKILEYLAAARPVVSTPKGAEGLDCHDGHDLLLAEPAAFADAIRDLAQHPDQARAIATQGRRLAAQFDWSTTILPRWREVTNRWLEPDSRQTAPVRDA